tara:strand:+ start:24954 stop:26453 length:1500 start_codon:yes stop_codon:yes gene_type:complete
MFQKIRILSRKSTLSKIQAETVGKTISNLYPNLKIDYDFIKTKADKNLNLNISQPNINDIGIFTNEVSKKISSGKFDLGIHSWKDYPIVENKNSNITATIFREDMRDILFLKKNINHNIKIMTSSPRRRFALKNNLKNIIPLNLKGIEFKNLRGNIYTRIKKFINDESDGLVVAKAAIDRLLKYDISNSSIKKEIIFCLNNYHVIVLPLSMFPTTPGQGALGIEVNKKNDKMKKILNEINNKSVFNNVSKEREILSQYGGGCNLELGISVWKENNRTIKSIYGRTDDGEIIKSYNIINEKIQNKKKVSKNNIFPKNLTESKIFNREQLNSNKKIELIKNSYIYISRYNTLDSKPKLDHSNIVITSGMKSWFHASKLGYWIHGTTDGLGEEKINKNFNFFDKDQYFKLSYKDKENTKNTIETYNLTNPKFPLGFEKRKFFFWMSFIAFREAISQYPEILNKNHSCGMGNSYKKIKNIIPDSKKLTCYLSYEDWKKDILND